MKLCMASYFHQSQGQTSLWVNITYYFSEHINLRRMLDTAQTVYVFGVILVRVFPHSDWIRRETECLFVFNPNAGKYRPKYLRIRTLFRQCGWVDLYIMIWSTCLDLNWIPLKPFNTYPCLVVAGLNISMYCS